MIKQVDLDTLAQQLNQLFELLSQFETTLDQEAAILKSTDLTPLTELLKYKESLSEDVSNCFSNLSKTLATDPLSLNEFMLLEEFKQLPQVVQNQFQKTSEKAITCSDKNIANGMLVHALNNMNSALLQMLKGQDPSNKTYTASGESKNDSHSSKPLGTA